MTTLYVTDQGAYLRVRHQQFQVVYEQALKCSVPVNRVSHVVLFGTCNVSHGAVSLALRRRIPILYLASNGSYFGRLASEGHAQIDYLARQVACAQDPDFGRRQAASIIVAKLHNSRKLLQRLNRKRPTEIATSAIDELAALIEQVPTVESVESMLGYEGQGANLYFQAYASLLKGRFEFEKRTRRPPTDPVNSLLSLGYTLLSQHVHSMVEVAGLHTHFGNLHKPHKNRPSLVCDLVEEFRAFVVDTLVAYLINSNIFTPEDFTPPDARGGVYLQPDALKKFLKHWEEKLQQQVTHPHTGHRVSYRRCFELQVWEYVSCLMGEQETYRAMTWEK
jgi:CRISPR-associated endonuclease Cas1